MQQDTRIEVARLHERLQGLDKRVDALKQDVYCEIDKRVTALKDDMDRRVRALNEAKHQNASVLALVISLVAIIATVIDIVFLEVRR